VARSLICRASCSPILGAGIRVRGVPKVAHRLGGTFKPPKILPAPLAMGGLARLRGDPSRHLRARPAPARRRRALECVPELVLERSGEYRRRAHALRPLIGKGWSALIAVTHGDLTDGTRAVASRGGNLGYRCPVGEQTGHLPAPPLGCHGGRRLARRYLRAA